MKWIFTISIVVFFHGLFAQDIKVFEDSLISLLKNVQTEKNAQLAKIHNKEFRVLNRGLNTIQSPYLSDINS